MAHKFNPANKRKLDDQWRRQNLPPKLTLEKLGLNSDDTLADIGCGIGYFTIPAAKVIKSAHKVFALDISEEMLTEVKKRADAAGISNIVSVKTEEYDLKLPDQSVSFVLLVNVLHEIDNQGRFLGEVYRILKTDGKIALIDWEKKTTEMGPPLDHRISSQDAKGLLQPASFELLKEMSFAETFYGLVAIKK